MKEGHQGDEGQRPLWEELLLMAIPILLTEGVLLLREHLHRKAKKNRKKAKDAIPIPRA
jgi:hypothetical protein